MDRREVRERARFVYDDELQYALAREDEINTETIRERATIRFVRDLGEDAVYELGRGFIDGIARNVERNHVVDFTTQQLAFHQAIRTGDNILVPAEKARAKDWIAFDEIRERTFQEHAAKRVLERQAIKQIIDRLYEYGGDPTTIEACPDRFPEAEAA